MGKETAEQKLLKLIESPSSPESAKAPGGDVASQMARAVRRPGFLGLAIPPALRSMLALGKSSSGSPVHFSFGLREINKILLLAIIAIFVFLLVDFSNGTKSLQKKIDLTVDINPAKTSSSIIPLVRSLDDYLALVEERNIFQPFEKKVVPEKSTAETSSQQSLKKIAVLTEKLKLVGVSWQDSAETASAMIEDTESGITYFVHQGERVKELTVKAIYANQVVLTYEGEEMTIGL